jgi:hypothetical protein
VLPLSLSNVLITYIIFGENLLKIKLADSSFIVVALFVVCGFGDETFQNRV